MRAEEYGSGNIVLILRKMKQNILKWLLVTSFGYMGFNKARFGRIECHESITAYGREAMLNRVPEIFLVASVCPYLFNYY